MDPDERDLDLVREVGEQRRARATARRHASAWYEPPDYYDDDPEPTCSRCAAPLADGNDGCRDPACPNEEV
jgi:hypothetical protein